MDNTHAAPVHPPGAVQHADGTVSIPLTLAERRFIVAVLRGQPAVEPIALDLLIRTIEPPRGKRKPAPPVSLADAATMLGLKPSTLRHQIKNGRLAARKVGRDWLVDRAEVERYR